MNKMNVLKTRKYWKRIWGSIWPKRIALEYSARSSWGCQVRFPVSLGIYRNKNLHDLLGHRVSLCMSQGKHMQKWSLTDEKKIYPNVYFFFSKTIFFMEKVSIFSAFSILKYWLNQIHALFKCWYPLLLFDFSKAFDTISPFDCDWDFSGFHA